MTPAQQAYPRSAPLAEFALPQPAAAPPRARPVYAGFWRRVGAALIDLAVFGLICWAIVAVGGLALGQVVSRTVLDPGGHELTDLLERHYTILGWTMVGAGSVYFALLEALPVRGPLGKRLLGIQAEDGKGKRIGLFRATFRYAFKLVSLVGCLGLGFLLAGMSARKQAFHDMLSGSVLTRRTPAPRAPKAPSTP